MVTVAECGIQVDVQEALPEIELSNGLVLDKQRLSSTDSTGVIIEEDEEETSHEYICDCCCRCLLCERGYPWYSLRGKSCLWVLLLTPGYVVLGVIMLPFFILMTIAHCVAASFE
ncbi:uncharacterized protein [Montipora foliosa]|uniref:uncharacterized protein isoform X2 n=1 Tax=Montipora foliosa TaxID=591990 RepID=UPI0035F15A80